MSTVPKGLFSSGLDDISLKLLKHTRPLPNERQLRHELVLQGLRAAEALVVAPKVHFRVHGENVVLAILARAIGTKGVIELLEEDAMSFVLWNSAVMYVTTPDKLMGVRPIMGGTMNSPHESDPAVSAEMGLRRWAEWMPEADRRQLARLAADRTRTIPPNSGQVAVERIARGFESGALKIRGVKCDAYEDMTIPERAAMADVAGDLQRVAVALESGLDFHEDEDGWHALRTACAKLQAPERVVELAEDVLHLERLPSIANLLLFQIITHEDIPKLRRRRETEEFRRWLWSQPDPADRDAVAKSYLTAMAPHVDLKDRRWFKAARILSLSALGSAIGGTLGGVIGGVAGGVAGTAAELALSTVDGFWLDAILSRPNPRRFATDVLQPLITTRTQPHPQLEHGGLHQLVRRTEEHVSRGSLAITSPAASPGHAQPEVSAGDGASADDGRRRERNKRKARRRSSRKSRRKNRG